MQYNKLSVSVVLLAGFILSASGQSRVASAANQQRDEFNGPFASWANVKKRFGAKGDGKTDDTKALQRALDELADRSISFKSGKGGYTVVYLPAGTYRISGTLRLKGKIGVSIIGEDPSKTIIRWHGSGNDTMLWANGSAHFKVSRIGWNPNGRKGMEGIGIHWKEKWNRPGSRSYAPLNIEVSDCYFYSGFAVGLGGGSYGSGWTGHNDSEVTVRRCRFYDCERAGIEIKGYNALDYWIWDCRFMSCKVGIEAFAGNYHAYRCYFSESTLSDFHQSNSYYTSARWCYSENSNAFSLDAGNSCSPFKRVFQGNTVVNPAEMPIEFYHLGRMTFFDNEFGQGRKPKHPYTINQNGWCQGIYAIMALNNKFSSGKPIRLAPANKIEYVMKRDSLRSFSKASVQFRTEMWSLPPKIKRTVYEIPVGAKSAYIQQIINKASKLRKRAIVHFPFGQYTLDESLVIPAGSDIRLVGDGLLYASVLLPDHRLAKNKPLIVIKGPSEVEIKDMQLGPADRAFQSPVIVFENADQPGARAFLDQIYCLADTALFMKGNNYLVVQKENSFFADGNYIEGGALVNQNKGTSKVLGFGGQFARLSTLNNARFIARDVWWEGKEKIPLDLKGSGSITIDGAMVAPIKKDSLTTIRIDKFKGRLTLLNMYVQGALEVRPDNPDLELLAWNINFYYKMNPVDFIKRNARFKVLASGFTAQCFDKKQPQCGSIPLSFGEYSENIKDKEDFISTMTMADRVNVPMQYVNLKKGVSNVYISRVSIGRGDRGVSFIQR